MKVSARKNAFDQLITEINKCLEAQSIFWYQKKTSLVRVISSHRVICLIKRVGLKDTNNLRKKIFAAINWSILLNENHRKSRGWIVPLTKQFTDDIQTIFETSTTTAVSANPRISEKILLQKHPRDVDRIVGTIERLKHVNMASVVPNGQRDNPAWEIKPLEELTVTRRNDFNLAFCKEIRRNCRSRQKRTVKAKSLPMPKPKTIETTEPKPKAVKIPWQKPKEQPTIAVAIEKLKTEIANLEKQRDGVDQAIAEKKRQIMSLVGAQKTLDEMTTK